MSWLIAKRYPKKKRCFGLGSDEQKSAVTYHFDVDTNNADVNNNSMNRNGSFRNTAMDHGIQNEQNTDLKEDITIKRNRNRNERYWLTKNQKGYRRHV